jgi:hypothetical protein
MDDLDQSKRVKDRVYPSSLAFRSLTYTVCLCACTIGVNELMDQAGLSPPPEDRRQQEGLSRKSSRDSSEPRAVL